MKDNNINLWYKYFPWPMPEYHKYDRGSAIVMGGHVECTGAARLAAYAALRTGAGLVSIACDQIALPIYAGAMMSVMTKLCHSADSLDELLSDTRHTAYLIGPGHGVNEQTRAYVLRILAQKTPCVLDADALTAFADNPQPLFEALHGQVVLTPHEGEFNHLFSIEGDRPSRAKRAAEFTGAVVLLKGAETVIAAPDGSIICNKNAPPHLATAGSGDILAGIITGLLAQGMPSLFAAAAGAWIHGESANLLDVGMISEDLLLKIPEVLKTLKHNGNNSALVTGGESVH